MAPSKDMEALGKCIKEARLAKGLSVRRLASLSGLTHSFVSKLEFARYESVSPPTLMALARALDLKPEDLFALAGFKLPKELPSFAPYLRARYGEELPDAARAALNELFDTLRRNYEGSDVVDDEDDERHPATAGRN